MERSMSTGWVMDAALLERLSALADGEVDASVASSTCASWRTQSQARATWHAYHLIGDVLRSEDLAADPARDTAFVRALRARMLQEPVVVAFDDAAEPFAEDAASADAVVVAPHRGWRWKAVSAVAAGFVAVVGGVIATRPVDPGSAAPSVALAPRAAAPAALGPSAEGRDPNVLAASERIFAPGAVASANGRIIRDARLDGYLAAHKQFVGSSALGVPSAFLRSVTLEAPASR
jgi:sigma-E factor negative regulatory protein RseA